MSNLSDKTEIVRTIKLYIDLAIYKFISTEDLTQTTPFVSSIAFWTTKRKAVIIVCFLWIIIGTNFIYPKGNWVILLILQKRQKEYQQKYLKNSYQNADTTKHWKTIGVSKGKVCSTVPRAHTILHNNNNEYTERI